MSEISKQVIGELISCIGQDMDINPSSKKAYLSKLDYVLKDPSDQGEAERLREALKKIMDEVEKHTTEMFSDHIHLIGHRALVDQALSSHTEDTSEPTVRSYKDLIEMTPYYTDQEIRAYQRGVRDAYDQLGAIKPGINTEG
jgi:acetate kinase